MKPYTLSVFVFLLISVSNCYSLEKRYTYGSSYGPSPSFEDGEEQFEEGEPVWIIDSIGHYFFSIPSKIVLWNRKMDNHQISSKTKEYLKRYIKDNNLRDVKVRFNQYAPLDEWRRIVKNDSINPWVKYIVGPISWFSYTFLPGRLLSGTIGGDHYNPFSNTIHIYSDLSSVALHEGGHAKDFSLREKKTLYAVAYAIPVVGSLYHEARATDDALNYLAEQNDKEGLEEAHEVLIPAYSTYVGGSIGDVVVNPITAVAIIPGHFYGRYKKKSIPSSLEKRNIPKRTIGKTE